MIALADIAVRAEGAQSDAAGRAPFALIQIPLRKFSLQRSHRGPWTFHLGKLPIGSSFLPANRSEEVWPHRF